MKAIDTYLTFDGNCRTAMKFYEKVFGGELQMMSFSDVPGDDFPKEAKDRIMHARLAKGAMTIVMASDSMPGMPFTHGNNFSISIQTDDAQDTDRLFNALAENGKAVMPPQETFWAARFGMLTDQFGINWMFNLEKSQ